MLQAIDQWAFQVLFALYGLLGIQDIPREPSPDWKVIERWTEQPDKTYRLVIESESVAKICRDNLAQFVLFPQTYLSRHIVLVDEHVVSTNSVGEKWQLGTIFDRLALSCRLFESGSKIRMEVLSYQQFFNGISNYPNVVNGFPYDNVFYNSIYLIAATICMCLGLVGAVLIRKLQPSESTAYFLLKDLILAIFIISYAPGYLFLADIAVIHTLMGLALTTSFMLLIKPIFFQGSKGLISLSMLLVVNTIAWFGAYNLKNISQLLLVMYSVPFVLVLAFANIIILHRKKHVFTVTEKLTYLVILFLAAQDINVAYYSREGFFHLSLLVIVISVVNFLKIVNEVNRKTVEMSLISEKLSQETNMVNKLNFLHEKYRETIHDIKSPISALNLFANGKDISGEIAVKLSGRFDEILKKIENNGLNLTLDWYIPQLFQKCIADVFDEKNSSCEIIMSKSRLSRERLEIFFDPVELKVILSELIDNSVKATSCNLRVNIDVDFTASGDEVILTVKDNGPGAPPEMVGKLGLKGFTTNGTGMGLFSIKRKVEEQGGQVNFTNMEDGFRCVISFAVREITNGI